MSNHVCDIASLSHNHLNRNKRSPTDCIWHSRFVNHRFRPVSQPGRKQRQLCNRRPYTAFLLPGPIPGTYCLNHRIPTNKQTNTKLYDIIVKTHVNKFKIITCGSVARFSALALKDILVWDSYNFSASLTNGFCKTFFWMFKWKIRTSVIKRQTAVQPIARFGNKCLGLFDVVLLVVKITES